MAPWLWWNDAKVQKELGLAAEKVRIINDIYTKRNDSLRALRDEFTRELAELDQVTRARSVDESAYSVKVTRVESLRSELNKSRTVMLYRLYRELTLEQYRKLQDIRDRRNPDRGRDAQPAK
jgi:Spy/CpxP family protein refolding chaperone